MLHAREKSPTVTTMGPSARKWPMQGSLNSCLHSSPFFYGYIQAAFGTLGLVATGPGQTPVIGTAITAISDGMALGRTQVSSLYLAATLLSACTLPFIGQQLDRVGPTIMFVGAAICLGGTCLSFADFVHASYSLGIAFYCLRLFGQGALTLVSQNAINLWFEKRRGRVMGVCGFVNSLCLTGLFSSVVKARVATVGWRRTYTLLGFLELCLVAPLGLLFIKQKPATYGLSPDGEPDLKYADLEAESKNEPSKNCETNSLNPSKQGTARDQGDELEPLDTDGFAPVPSRIGSSSADGESTPSTSVGECTPATPVESSKKDFTRSESLRTFAFWSMSAGAFTAAALGTALMFHLDAIFNGPEYDSHLSNLYFASAVSAGATTLLAGYLIDVVKPQYVMAGSMLVMSVMLVTTALVSWARASNVWLVAVGCLNGLSMGSFGACLGVAYAKWFGMTHNGQIQGTAQSIVVLGSAVGPLLVSVGHDLLGAYDSALATCASLPLLCSVMALCAREPTK